jgi:hypothetical protein
MNFLEQLPDSDLKKMYDLLAQELREALVLYWDTASRILANSGITLLQPEPEDFSLEKHFFSALFLYSYFRAGLPQPKRILYAAVNQCLRGMVTGCDNILDDEYKLTLKTDLPGQGTRFRSILDIMVSDRVLFELLNNAHYQGEITPAQVSLAITASLCALTRSGVQEASEEHGINERFTPEDILSSIHHYKTGLLFQSPWAIPKILEDFDLPTFSTITEALYQIGMGCQILDDMVDLARDLQTHRHNYVASLLYHHTEYKQHTQTIEQIIGARQTVDLLDEFPAIRQAAARTALHFLNNGMKGLFADAYPFMAQPAILFIAQRIGADRFLGEKLSRPC